jgi:hypothetical protein
VGQAGLVLAIILVVGGIVAFLIWRWHQRREACRALASQLGFTYHTSDPFNLDALPFDAFDRCSCCSPRCRSASGRT